jgi:hypothetical protein
MIQAAMATTEFHGVPLAADSLVITGCDRTTLNHP